MRRYANLSGHAGVVAYEAGPDFIDVKFKDGEIYRYTYDRPGMSQVEAMKKLAAAGRGLTTHINRHVRDLYAAKRR